MLLPRDQNAGQNIYITVNMRSFEHSVKFKNISEDSNESKVDSGGNLGYMKFWKSLLPFS
jgi:hypothetical protein